jgi:hypothetical protein
MIVITEPKPAQSTPFAKKAKSSKRKACVERSLTPEVANKGDREQLSDWSNAS